MLQKLWRFIMPKPLHDEETVAMRTGIYWILITSLIISGTILGLGLLSRAPFTTLVAGLGFVLSVGLLWLSCRGYLTVVRLAGPACTFAIATYVILARDGVHDEGVFIYPLTLVVAGLLLGKRGIMIYTVLTLGVSPPLVSRKSMAFWLHHSTSQYQIFC